MKMVADSTDMLFNGGVYTIQQTSSKLSANVFKIYVLMLDVC